MHICPQEIILFMSTLEGVVPFVIMWYHTKLVPLFKHKQSEK